MKDLTDIERTALTGSVEQASRYLRALSNPSRLLLLCELVKGERNVGELEAALGLGQAYVSQQLARLRSEGLVSARKDGRIVFYSLSDGKVRPMIAMLYELFCADWDK